MPRFFELGGDGGIGEDFLHAGLGVVKVALHGVNLHVRALLGCHLQVLDFTRAVVRVENFDLNAVEVGVARQCGLAGVAGGRDKDAGRLGATEHLLRLDQQLRHELQGIVLERAGRVVPQFEGVQAVAHFDGLARLAAERVAVSGSGRGAQEVGAVVGQETGQHFFCQFAIGKALPAFEVSLREIFRYKQTALRCQTTDDRLLCGNAECGISGAQILHTFTPFLLFTCLYMYTPRGHYTFITAQTRRGCNAPASPCLPPG